MPVIDVQVHPFDRNHPGRPWASPSHGLLSATGEMVAAMNSVGVDGAIVSSFSAYECDRTTRSGLAWRTEFRVVTPVDASGDRRCVRRGGSAAGTRCHCHRRGLRGRRPSRPQARLRRRPA
jgi:hypothetical protein